MADDLDTEYDDSYDPERPYGDASVEGWQPPEEREFRKLLDAYRKANPSEFCRESLFEAKTARAWQREITTKEPPAELFGPLWRKGELAVLFGASGAGKSILAVQIAESIARGKSYAFTRDNNITPKGVTPTEVLYFDFERSPQQFDERYSCLSPIPGKLPIKYRFSSKLKFARLANMEIPEIFQGNFSAYFEHSLALTAETGGDKVIIVDNLEWLDIKTTSPAASIRRMRALKRCCMMTGTSILVLQSSPPQAFRTPNSALRTAAPLRIPNSMFRIFEPADSIFAIGHSTFAPDIRYVKPLKSSSPPSSIEHSALCTVHSNEVLTYQLARIPHSAIRTPHSEGPFLSLTYLGPSAESDHLRDYAAEAEARYAAEANRLKRIRDPRHVVEMLMSPEYRRYIKGER